MFESAAICLQLADLDPEASFIAPLGSPERALVYQWVLFAMTELEAPLFRWIRETAENSADPPSRERFAQAAAALQTALDGRDWLLGDRFTVADVMCASVLGGAHSRGLLTEWPGLQAYVERGESRPAFIKAAAISNQPRRERPTSAHGKPSTGGGAAALPAFLHHRILTVTGTVAATRELGRTRSCVAAALASDRDDPYVAIALARPSAVSGAKAIASVLLTFRATQVRPTRPRGAP